MGLKAAKFLMLAPKAGAALLSAGADAGFDVTTVVSDSVKTVQSQLLSILGVVVPAIVAITAAVVGVKFAIGWIKKIRG